MKHLTLIYLMTLASIVACTSDKGKSVKPSVQPNNPQPITTNQPTTADNTTVNPAVFTPLPSKDSLAAANTTPATTPGTAASVTPGTTVAPTLPAGTPTTNNTGNAVPGIPVTPPATVPTNPTQPTVPVLPLNPINTTVAATAPGSGVACRTGNITKDQINAWVQAAGGATGSVRYMYVPTDLLVAGKERSADLARVGGLKALFHTSFVKEIGGFTDVSEGHCAVYKLELDKIWGQDWQQNWRVLSSSTPLPDRSFDVARQPFARMSQETRSEIQRGLISATRIAYNATFPTNYQALAKIPQDTNDISRERSVARGGYVDGIPCGPRTLHVRPSQLAGEDRLYFVSADPSRNEQGQQFPASPPRNRNSGLPGAAVSRQITGSEAIQQLPNGMLRYFVWRNPGDKGTKALQSGVIDPANPHNGYTLVVGRSCIMCHNNGIRGVPVDTANLGNGWSTNEELDQYFNSARNEYFEAMTKIVRKVVSGDTNFQDAVIQGRTREPVAYLINRLETNTYGQPRSSRPYTQCRTAGGDKFQRQIQGMFAQIDEEIKALDSGSVAAPAAPAAPVASGSNTPTPTVNGLEAYRNSCTGAGCHNVPASSDRLIRGGTSIPARMLSNARRKNPGLDQAQIQAIETYLRTGS